jgi:hypothetical protein
LANCVGHVTHCHSARQRSLAAKSIRQAATTAKHPEVNKHPMNRILANFETRHLLSILCDIDHSRMNTSDESSVSRPSRRLS